MNEFKSADFDRSMTNYLLISAHYVIQYLATRMKVKAKVMGDFKRGL